MSRDQVAEKKNYEIIHKNQEITPMYDPNNDNPYELMILMTLIKVMPLIIMNVWKAKQIWHVYALVQIIPLIRWCYHFHMSN